MQICNISEQLNQGYLDEFLSSIQKSENSEINSNFLQGFSNLDEENIGKVNWIDFLDFKGQNIPFSIKVLALANHFDQNLMGILNSDQPEYNHQLCMWVLSNTMN